MARTIETSTVVDRERLLEFIRPRHHAILSTARKDGTTQMSPIAMGVDDSGRIVIATYPHRTKVLNIRRHPAVSLCVLSDDFAGEWVQVYGSAEIIDLPDSVEPLVEYFRSIAGEHPDWDEYREAMVKQGKSLIRITIDTWGPVARGGFPAHLVEG